MGAQCCAGHETGPRGDAGAQCAHHAATAAAAEALDGSPAEAGRHVNMFDITVMNTTLLLLVKVETTGLLYA